MMVVSAVMVLVLGWFWVKLLYVLAFRILMLFMFGVWLSLLTLVSMTFGVGGGGLDG
jgi:hypothetical protein